MPLSDVDVVRLNARIAKQREELAHKEFVIRELRAEIERLQAAGPRGKEF